MAETERSYICRDCMATFSFDSEERAEFASRGLTNTPSRCAACRTARKTRQESLGRPRPGPGFRERREVPAVFVAVCAACGLEAVLPFPVRRDRVAYCSSCYEQRRAARSGSDSAAG